MTFDSAYKILNDEQRNAVDTIDGPVMVVAGPGTGKTQVLTLRIANILKNSDVDPSNILALTFTENAAYNMRERLKQFIGITAYKVKITTFHSFCNEVIQKFPEKFAFNTELTQINDLSRYNLIQKIISNYRPKDTQDKFVSFFEDEACQSSIVSSQLLKPFNAPYLFQHDIIQSIDNLKREFILPGKFEELIKAEIEEFNEMEKVNPRTKKPFGKWVDKKKLIFKNIELLHIYREYENKLRENAKYDFIDMIAFVTKALSEDDELLAYFQEQYLYILVDEYQDTNGAQNEVVKTLGSWDDQPNVFVVGDDDQSIFRFQGANLSNILDFKKTYPSTKVISLVKNYRSTQQVLDLAKSVIEKNSERLVTAIEGVDKNIKSVQTKTAPIGTAQSAAHKAKFPTGEIENLFIVEKIQELIDSKINPSDIAIIYHKHRDGEKVLDYLLKAKIPVSLTTKSNILDEQIIIQLNQLLRLIQDPSQEELFATVLKFEFLKLDRLDIFKLLNHVGTKRGEEKESLIEVVLDKEILNEVGLQQAKEVTNFANKVIKWNQDETNKSFVEFFDIVINESGLLESIKKEHNADDLNSLKTVFDFVKTRNREETGYSLNDYLNDLNVMGDAGLKIKKEDLKTSEEGVNMLTAHASKGLEFDYVFVPKLIDKTWGNVRNMSKIKLVNLESRDMSWHTSTNKNDLSFVAPQRGTKNEEERRLLFVTLTRAKHTLFLTHAEKYLNDSNDYRQTSPSQFLEELDTKLVDELNTSKYEKEPLKAIELTLERVPQLNLIKQEQEYIKELLKKFKLSITALNTYLKDPQEFLYRNLLREPRAKIPVLALGTAVHSALEYFYRKFMDDEKKDLTYLLFVFEKALEKEFLGEADYEELLAEGKKIMSEWYDYYSDNLIEPIGLEYGFYGNNITLEDIPLTAKIDKIEWVDEKRKEVRVIDYKTGSAKTKGQILKPVDGGEDSNYYRQLVFYKLIAEQDARFPYKVVECELDFVKGKNGKFKKERFEIPDEDVEKLKELIIDTVKKIRNLEF